MFSPCFGQLFKRKRVFVTRIIPKIGFELLLSKKVEVCVWNSDEAIPRNILKTNIQDGYDGLICMYTDKIDTEILDAAGNVYKFKFSFTFFSQCMKQPLLLSTINVFWNTITHTHTLSLSLSLSLSLTHTHTHRVSDDLINEKLAPLTLYLRCSTIDLHMLYHRHCARFVYIYIYIYLSHPINLFSVYCRTQASHKFL